MKILRCVKCNKAQKEGKFCLDCGQSLKEIVTTDVVFKPIKSSRGSETLKKDIRRWLNRIGVQNPDIEIHTGPSAEIEYLLQGHKYTFKSVLQDNTTNNLAAVEQFLHHRVLGIERGIETADQAFKGYQVLPDPNSYLEAMSDSELRRELKNVHPDTGTGDSDRWHMLLAEKKRRGEHDA